MKTILIAGGTGFIGQFLEKYFSNKGYIVKILSRNPKRENEILWDAKTLNASWVSHLENIEVLINLSGKSINCKFTDANKKAIKDSRVITTQLLGEAINSCNNPPKIWMNSSTTSIYKASYTEEMTEDNTDFGNDFEAMVGKVWENAFYKIKNVKTRKIVLRTSIVFGKNDGAFVPLKKLTKFGLGGKQGNGKQMVSWIHETDFARAVEFLILNQNTTGAFNLCVPKPTDNATMMQDFRKIIGIPFGIPSPKLVLKIGSAFINTEPELILNSRNVIPKKLLKNGFQFKYPTITTAVKNLIKNT